MGEPPRYFPCIFSTAISASRIRLNTTKAKHGGFLAIHTSMMDPYSEKASSISRLLQSVVRSATCTRASLSSSPPLSPWVPRISLSSRRISREKLPRPRSRAFSADSHDVLELEDPLRERRRRSRERLLRSRSRERLLERLRDLDLEGIFMPFFCKIFPGNGNAFPM